MPLSSSDGPLPKNLPLPCELRRPGGTCVAGKEFAGGKASDWIRPINAANNGAISLTDRLYNDKSHAHVLDIVKVTLLAPKPHLHHQEDHQIDEKKY
jgi:hypothetical protein